MATNFTTRDITSFKEYKFYILSDLFRINSDISIYSLIQQILFGESYKYIFWMRTCRFSRDHFWLKLIIYPIAHMLLKRYMYKFGISVPFTADIGCGFYIGHYGGIVVSPYVKIGKNCNISHGVTVGQSNRGSKKGCPVIGDNVLIGPGAKIFGSIIIGNSVAIGSNCVVTKDVPDNAVVVGNPGRIISFNGSKDYINRINYESIICKGRNSQKDCDV